MDGLVRIVGDGLGGIVHTAFDGIGVTLRFIVASLNGSLPAGTLLVAGFFVLAAAAWTLAKR